MAAASAKETRRRLSKYLRELTRIKPDDLVRRDPFFKVGVRDFQSSLDLFRKLARSNLKRVPSDYLVHVADHAEKALGQFRNVLAFNGGGAPNSGEACGFMLNEIRATYREMYEDLTTIISNPHGRGERVSEPMDPMTIVAGILVLGLIAAATIVYYFGTNIDLGQKLVSLFHI
jgi:hypothetical protein